MSPSRREPHTEAEIRRGRTEGHVRQRARRSWFARQIERTVIRRLRVDETSGWPVIIAGIIAMVWANVAIGPDYEAFWSTEVTLGAATWRWGLPLRDIVDVFLLPLFFFVVAVEIREEFREGHLAGGGKASLPLAAAVGGMLVPAGLYLFINRDTPYTAGFGVPVATDIAFALAFLQILGDRVPKALRAFLLAFAAVDDVGGIVLIAVIYGHGLALPWLGAAILITAAIVLLARRRAQLPWIYVALGIALWGAMLGSGIHVTIAGVVLGLILPTRPLFDPDDVVDHVDELDERLQSEKLSRDVILGELEELAARTESISERFSRNLRPWVSYVVLPLFGLAMAGTAIDSAALGEALRHPASIGIVLALLVGKPIGVFGATWLAARLGATDLPRDVAWLHVFGAALLAGIGFTVSLFIAKLAFDPAEMAPVRIAIFSASIVAAMAGVVVLRFADDRR